ncbi:nitroreductase family deazaflavin-dependent oxidoreductase [Nocardiopsis gilva YIM 90087]|uniref:Nitroreductase family deazaflavin-dependent oxidoreductase n=1 Tax=Nocardiopsis gilva YIM 90087 TaxID=1235441 RepID=A0A223SBA9_9ACTN|nr:nitroreductase family deazaflavin-dependent oxidoreductase [Nocardiopsis gilva]ASU85375.1 nitroreductase family deazaflavin-dependent oxidoreductase [Nocardiopsis gilva YIM 90087]
MPRQRPPALDSPLTTRILKVVSRVNTFAYRATDGYIGGKFPAHSGAPDGIPVCLLTTRGRKSGRLRTTPLLYLSDSTPEGERVILVASQGGRARNPMWFRNLLAEPTVVVQTGGRMRRMRARVADEQERAELWPRLVELYPDYDAYQSWTDRVIPVVICEAATQPAI